MSGRYQIRRVDGRWWSAYGWEIARIWASTFHADELPEYIPSTNINQEHTKLASREGKEWCYCGKLVAKAIHIGG